MTPRRNTTIALGLVALGILGIWGWAAGWGVTPVRVGGPAPEFRAVTVDAPMTEKRLADYAGSVVLVNIWATWCAPCIVEMPSLEALHKRYVKDGLRIIAVSVDAAGSEQQIREFRDRLGLTFEILHDRAGIRSAYQTAGVPESFVIGRDGRIRRRVFSAEDWDSPSNRALVEQLLGVRSQEQEAGIPPTP